jgi:mono/diheme cytochrome c family protein
MDNGLTRRGKRRTRRLEVLMKMIRSTTLAALLAAGALPALAADAAKPADVAKGKAVFSSAAPKCTGCHTEAKNPLAKAGAENSEADLKAWVRTPKEMMAKKGKKGVMPAYGPAKIADTDLEALVDYLETMK